MLGGTFQSAHLCFLSALVLFFFVFNGLSPLFAVFLTFHIPAGPISLLFSVFFVLVLSLSDTSRIVTSLHCGLHPLELCGPPVLSLCLPAWTVIDDPALLCSLSFTVYFLSTVSFNFIEIVAFNL